MKLQVWLLLCIAFLTTITSTGQTSLGIEAGVNISNVNFDNCSALTGYTFGIQSQIPINNKFSINPYLGYSGKGWKFESISQAEEGGEFKLDYIDLQLLGNYAVLKKLAVQGGIEVGQLVKTTREPEESFIDDLYQKGDFSLVAGVSYTLLEIIHIGFKYLHGMSYLAKFNVTDVNGQDLGKYKEGNLRVFQFSVSANLIQLGKEDEG